MRPPNLLTGTSRLKKEVNKESRQIHRVVAQKRTSVLGNNKEVKSRIFISVVRFELVLGPIHEGMRTPVARTDALGGRQ